MEFEDSSDSQFFGSLSREFYYADQLMDAVSAEDSVEVRRLLEVQRARADVVVPERGVAALHLLAGLENEDFAHAVLLEVLTRGGDPNVRSEEGLTPVHVAAMWGRSRVLEVLLSSGGDPRLQDFTMRLNAEDYALKEHQWQAYGVLTTFAVIADDVDHFAKYVEEDLSCEARTTERTSGSLKDPLGCGTTVEDTIEDDYDWIGRTSQVIPLDERAIDIIKKHRRNTKLYQYPERDFHATDVTHCAPKLPKRNKNIQPELRPRPRKYKKNEESELYFCGFTESSYKSKFDSVQTGRDSSGSFCSDFDSGKVQSNKMLCKMSRIFLFMLKKRHLYQRIK